MAHGNQDRRFNPSLPPVHHQINLGMMYNLLNFGFGPKNNQCTQFQQNICFGAARLPSPVFEQCIKFRSLWPKENRKCYREKQHKNYLSL